MPGSAAPPRTTYLVKQLELAVRSELDSITTAFGVTALQFTALSVLARHPGMSSAQLARRSFVSAQAGNEMISILERKELISRAPDSNNRRILRISLTPAGQKLVDECDIHVSALERKMIESLSAAEVERLRAALSACIHSLMRQEPSKVPSPGR
jgi:DNA-binding MarR family transcriptional regulator